MSLAEEKLEALATALEAKGDDGQRLELVQRARRFKRSWVEMAEGLMHVRETRAYKRWGYQDFFAYCDEELQLKQATAEKLTGSYVALKRYAPQVLQRDGVAQPIPSCDAVDYLAQALTGDPANDGPRGTEEPPAEAVEELKQAVFDEGRSVASLRRRFNPIFHPKPPGAAELQSLERTSSTADRLASLVTKVESLPSDRVNQVLTALEALKEDLAPLIAAARADMDEPEAASA